MNPISPHLGIYRFSVSMVMSICHRITGVALYFTSLIFLTWLICLEQGQQTYQQITAIADHPLAKVVFVIIAFIFFHHLYGGVRHIMLDVGDFYQKNTIQKFAHATWIASMITTAICTAICWIILSVR